MNGHGNGLVARKLHGVVGATLGHAAQLGDVVEHFRERHERLDRLHATRLVAELVDGTTTRVQVTDNVTHGFFRGDDINLHDGLQKLRGALGDAFSERALGGDFESHDGGIDVVVRTIEQGGAQVHDRETGDDTRAHHLFQTARDARNVFLRHGATLDVGGELETGTRFERFKLDFNLGVLTGTTRLLLVRVLDFTRLGDRFTVVDLRRADVGFNLEFALEAIDDDVEVKLTHTFDDGLVGFFVTREVERRIFLRELDQTGGHLFDVSLGLRLDGNLDNGIGELHAFEDNLLSLVAQRVTGGGVLETSDGDDVTSARHFDVLTLVRVHLEEATDAFLLTLDGVVRVRAGFDDARVHAGEGERTDERISHDLERQRRERFIVIRLAGELLFGVIDVGTLDIRDIRRRRQVREDGVEHRLDTLVLERGAAQHRDEGERARALTDALDNLFLGRFFTFEVLFHDVVVLLDGHFNHVGAHLFSLLLEVVRNFDNVPRRAELFTLPDERLHGDEIDDAGEVFFGADRDLERARTRAEVLDNHVDGAEVVGTHAIHLVHEAQTRNVVLVGLAPDGFGLRFDTGDGVEEANGAVEHAKRAFNFQREIDVTRGIDDVDTVIVPRARGRGGRNRDTALLFLFHPVHRRRAFVHFADFVRATGVVQHAFRRRRLTRIDVGHDTDVAVLVQRNLPFFGFFALGRANDAGASLLLLVLRSGRA